MKIDPAVRVRAIEYVIADSKAPEGWRALTWNDLATRPGLLGPGPSLPEPFGVTVRDPARGLTVDEVALQIRKFDVRKEGRHGCWPIRPRREAGGRCCGPT